MKNLRTTSIMHNCIIIIYLFFLLFLPSISHGQQLRIDNTAKYIASNRYEWTVFVVGEQSVLDTIQYVEYVLHPTFPDPIKKVYDRNTDFALSGEGWGEFNIKAKIVFDDGRKLYLAHPLSFKEGKTSQQKKIYPPSKPLSKPLPKSYKPDSLPKTTVPPMPLYKGNTQSYKLSKPIEKQYNITAGNTSKYVGKRRWEWTVFIIANDKTLEEVECVEYTLHPTFSNPVQKVCDKGSTLGKGFFLRRNGWGTFIVKIKVIFKNGEINYLEHPLVFN